MRLLKNGTSTGAFDEGAVALRCGRDLRRSYSGLSARVRWRWVAVAPAGAPPGAFGEGAVALRCGRDLRRSYSGLSAKSAAAVGCGRALTSHAAVENRRSYRGIAAGAAVVSGNRGGRARSGAFCRRRRKTRGPVVKTRGPIARKRPEALSWWIGSDRIAMVGFAPLTATLRGPLRGPCIRAAAAVTCRRRPSPFRGIWWSSPIRCRTTR
jgi:hypothetical protein